MSNIARKLIDEMDEQQQKDLKSWAEDAYVIRNDQSISHKEKIKKLSNITRRNKIALTFLKSFLKLTKRHAWDERGLPGKFALSGLVLGGAVTGGQWAGVASAGMGIGIPIYILTSAGGALLGTIINEIKS